MSRCPQPFRLCYANWGRLTKEEAVQWHIQELGPQFCGLAVTEIKGRQKELAESWTTHELELDRLAQVLRDPADNYIQSVIPALPRRNETRLELLR